jgi:hypothetical protein
VVDSSSSLHAGNQMLDVGTPVACLLASSSLADTVFTSQQLPLLRACLFPRSRADPVLSSSYPACLCVTWCVHTYCMQPCPYHVYVPLDKGILTLSHCHTACLPPLLTYRPCISPPTPTSPTAPSSPPSGTWATASLGTPRTYVGHTSEGMCRSHICGHTMPLHSRNREA